MCSSFVSFELISCCCCSADDSGDFDWVSALWFCVCIFNDDILATGGHMRDGNDETLCIFFTERNLMCYGSNFFPSLF